MKKYVFSYAPWATATVTVHASDYNQALYKAREAMDRRYEAQEREPPTGWTLNLLSEEEI